MVTVLSRARTTTERELRAERLAFALRDLAAELVAERRKVAQLRRENADLKARLESLEPVSVPPPTSADDSRR